MERNPDFDDDNLSLLIIELGAKTIECTNDVWLLFDEIESIAEDFPGYVVVARP